MRILFVTNEYPTDDVPGASPCVRQQQLAIEALGYDVDVFIIDRMASKLNYLKAALRIFWLSQIRHRYDIIHAHYGYICGLAARMQYRAPVVVTFRGSDVLRERERLVSRLLAGTVDQSIVMTEQMRQLLGRSNALTIPYGIDLELFKPGPQSEARRASGLPPDPPLILFPYNPQRMIKRFYLVEQAAAILGKEFPELRVIAIHQQPHEQVARYMNACDAMVLTSLREGAPVAIREAMACNLPIVSVDAGDVAAVIQGTDDCYIVRPDPEDIAAKLALVLRARRRTNGRRMAETMGLLPAAASVAAIYDELARKKSQRVPLTEKMRSRMKHWLRSASDQMKERL